MNGLSTLNVADTNHAARSYIDRGWYPVPIPKGEKGPKMAGWQEGGFEPDNFSPTQNVGLILDLSGLSEADFDCEEAAYAGRKFLPQSLDSGRSGELRKRFFRCTLDKEYRDIGTFKDGKWKPGDKILEVRHKGKQAMIAPSTHPSGERVEWLNDLEPIHIDPEVLRKQCDRVATVALIARHLPDRGRHNLAMAYAGFFLRKGLTEDEVLEILTVAWEYVSAPGEALKDLEALVSDTVEKIANDEPATGGNTLTQLIPGMTDALCDVWEWEKALTPEEQEERERQERTRRAQEAWPRCKGIARSYDVLDKFVKQLKASGHVGEERNIKLVYVSATSRLLDRPVSLIVKGPSSTGKNHQVESTLQAFPDGAYFAFTSMSEKALYYDDADYRHKMLYVAEAEGMNNQNLDYAVRSLLSEGQLRYLTVEKINGQMVKREIVKEGPTGMIQTTTRANLYHDNETRAVSITVNDTREQTKAIMRSTAREDEREPIDWEPWWAFQVWLEGQDNLVWIPFAEPLAEKMQALHVRQRRDFKLLLNAVRTIAIIHQACRERDYKGRNIAEYRDYEMAEDLLNDLLSEGIGATVSAATRDTVDAVRVLTEDATPKQEHVSSKAVANYLEIDKSAASRRINKALSDGYLVNLAEEGKRGKKLAVGSDLPENTKLLPEPEELAAAHVEGFCNRLQLSCIVAHVCGGKERHELFGDLMRTLVAQIVAPTRTTKAKLQSSMPLGSVRDFERLGTNKPDPAETSHEEELPDNVVALSPQTGATVQLCNKVSENITDSDTEDVTDQPTSATKKVEEPEWIGVF